MSKMKGYGEIFSCYPKWLCPEQGNVLINENMLKIFYDSTEPSIQKVGENGQKMY